MKRAESTARASDYREFPVPVPLREHLVCFWAQSISSPVEYAQPVFPDGCVDLLLIDGVPTVIGPWTVPFVSELAPGTTIVGARLQPGAAANLLGMPASELLNCNLPLDDVWSSRAVSEFARVADGTGLSSRLAAMQSAILGLVETTPADLAMQAAVRWIARHPHGRLDELSRLLGLSSRQFHRRFTAAVGYAPKLFQSVLRFQRLLHLAAQPGAGRTLAELAAYAGFADQAHMTREVRRFSGKPPGASLASPLCALRLSGLIHASSIAEN
jgi:AraC-like DNA-binding protein